MPITSPAGLVAILRQKRLLSPKQLNALTPEFLARFPDARALAKELIGRGWLTPRQVNRLFQGHTKAPASVSARPGSDSDEGFVFYPPPGTGSRNRGRLAAAVILALLVLGLCFAWRWHGQETVPQRDAFDERGAASLSQADPNQDARLKDQKSPQPEPKLELQPEQQPEGKPEAKPAVPPDPKSEKGPEGRPEKPQPKPEPTPEQSREAKPETKPEPEYEVKPEKPESKPESNSSGGLRPPLANPPAPQPKEQAVAFSRIGHHIISLAQDHQGNIWAGSEDYGLYRFTPKAEENDPTKGTWTQFGGLGDNSVYAIACDKLGRLWVGTLRSGVYVYNGKEWRNYDVLDGPIGERIFAIAACPTDGDVWLATSAGLTRYSLKDDAWRHYTRTDGLPSDQASAIAFDKEGNVYVGTHCDGIAIAKAGEDYKKWSVHAGPPETPLVAKGGGLPTDLINGLLASRSGTVYAATTTGLAWSKDHGKSWHFLRGSDYKAKVEGRVGGAPAGWKEAPKEVVAGLLPEDYVACLAEDAAGRLWLGFRQKGFLAIDDKKLLETGYLALDSKNQRHVFQGDRKTKALPDDYVFSILPLANAPPLFGTYGSGLAPGSHDFKAGGARPKPAPAGKDAPPLPSPAKPPALAEIGSMIRELNKVKSAPANGELAVTPLADDWRTQGDFFGESQHKDFRYGEGLATLCAYAAPFDAEWGRDALNYSCWGRTGNHGNAGEGLRRWIHWAKTDNVRALKNPFEKGRRQAEWDDHKEVYKLARDGPHVYAYLKMPPGTYYVAFYFHNKDGHEKMNRVRDYVLSVKKYAKTDAEFEKLPVLARSRVVNFWGGVYKVFVMSGGEYTVQMNANYSYDTICSGVFFDPVINKDELKRKHGDIPRVRYGFAAAEAETFRQRANGEQSSIPNRALAALGSQEELRYQNPSAFAAQSRRTSLAILRGLMAEGGHLPEKDAVLLNRARAECLNQVRLFDQRDAVYKALNKAK